MAPTRSPVKLLCWRLDGGPPSAALVPLDEASHEVKMGRPDPGRDISPRRRAPVQGLATVGSLQGAAAQRAAAGPQVGADTTLHLLWHYTTGAPIA